MVGILVVSHEPLASALLESAKMIMGDTLPQCDAHTLILGQDLDAFESELLRKAAMLDGGEGVLVLADLFAGTPANTAMRAMRERTLALVSGVNLGMLIEALSCREGASIDEVRDAALEAAHASIVDIGGKLPQGR